MENSNRIATRKGKGWVKDLSTTEESEKVIIKPSTPTENSGSIAARKGKGWLRDLPDFRDISPDAIQFSAKQEIKEGNGTVRKFLKSLDSAPGAKKKNGGTSVDLRQWCSPIEDQGQLGSCTAHAGVGLYEYFERRAHGKYIDGSRLFLYKATRNLLGWSGDDGAYLRTTMAALALFGVVPEKYWPYKVEQFNEEPSAFLYSYAQNYQAITYYRLDTPNIPRTQLLDKIRQHLKDGLPLIFGFTCYSSLNLADDGKIPFPDRNEFVEGGHAVMAVGYDDSKKIVNPGNNAIQTTGAFLIRNSWGKEWGDNGYGWLPYQYVLSGIADDWWSMTSAEWIDSNQFDS